MNNRYKELTPSEQDCINMLVNAIAASKGLLDSSRTCGDIDSLVHNLHDRSRLEMGRSQA